jgi:hypothetical protein
MMDNSYQYDVAPGQPWEVDLLKDKDAEGVARLFLSVYGKDYPIAAYLDPERLKEENDSGRIISAVARTAGGDVVGHSAMFRSAPYAGIREAGAGVVHPSYRGGAGIFTRLNSFLQSTAAMRFGVEGVHGEPVLNHIFSQKMARSLNWVSHALEVDLMPAAAYEKEKSATGRVSALLDFKTLIPKPHRVYLPPCYEEELRFLYAGLDDRRQIVLSDGIPEAESRTRIHSAYFEFAQVARVSVWEAGRDLSEIFAAEEQSLTGAGAIVLQVWLSLGQRCVASAVEELRGRGYFFGGLLPRWFDCDGILMQKIMQRPNWERCLVHFDRGKRIFEMVKADWLRSVGDK